VLCCTKCDTHQLGLWALYSKCLLSPTQNSNTDICGSADPVVLQVIDPALVHSSHYRIQFVIQFCGSFCDKPDCIFFGSNSWSLTGLQGQRHHHTIGASGRECRLQCNGADCGYTTSWPQRSRPEKQVCIQIQPEFTDTSIQDHPAQMDF
jgi:hypothetical protein